MKPGSKAIGLWAIAAAALLASGGVAQAQFIGSASGGAHADARYFASASSFGADPSAATLAAAVVNVEGVKPGRLKLTAQVLADIYRGKITRWDAPQIVSLNPGVALPHEPIMVVHHSEPSQVSAAFTGFLAERDPAFKAEVGQGALVAWRVGVGREGDHGVADFVRRTGNSIGYVEYGFAKADGLATARLIDGKSVPVRAVGAAPDATASLAAQITSSSGSRIEDWSSSDFKPQP
jgi:ABC-type phosphate transport system substrate-binding protein